MDPANPPQSESATQDSRGHASPSFLRYTVFRVYSYPHDYPAFEGKDLTPGPVLTDYLTDHPAKTPANLEDEVESE